MVIHRALNNQKTIINLKNISTNLNYELRRTKTTQYLTDDYQYLQRGQIPMLHFQRSLPRLPIPPLDKTFERYLAAVGPLTKSADELKHVEKVVNNYRTGVAPKLQQLLINHDKANKHTSYISKPWFDMYLRDRKPLPINYNPVLVMKTDEVNSSGYNNQLIRAGNLIISTLRFMRSLRENVLEPEVYHMDPRKSDTERFRKITSFAPQLISTFVAYAFKAFPLDMSQVFDAENANLIRLWFNNNDIHREMKIFRPKV